MSHVSDTAALLRRAADALEDESDDGEAVAIVVGVVIGVGANKQYRSMALGLRATAGDGYTALGAAKVASDMWSRALEGLAETQEVSGG